MSRSADASPDVMASAGAATCELRVGGMDCASCASSIEGALRKLEGVRQVRVDVMGGRVRVEYAGGALARGDLAGAIRRAGFQVEHDEPRRDGEVVAPPTFWSRRGRLVTTAAAGVLFGIALVAGRLGAPEPLLLALYALSTAAGGWYVLPRALRAARAAALDMSFLMSVAAIGAWIIGEHTEAAATLFLFAVAELLESYSMDRARGAIRALMDLSPAVATVRRDGREERVPAASVALGETVVVRPGEKIAVDGTVTGGGSSVNEAPITGESMPVEKEPGSEVFAGSLNGQGVLEVRSTRPASDTTLARIIHAVEQAQASRAPSQSFVDRFARRYTPIVVGMALLIAIAPPLAGFGGWETWIYRALAMLVVACPCALVISTPVTIVSGLTGAARAGVLIKGGMHLERAGETTTVVFDKTGTLTEGRPAVTDVSSLDGRTPDEVLHLALGVERHSEHPLARAIRERGSLLGIHAPPSTDFEALPGSGARARVNGDMVFVGNERLAGALGIRGDAVRQALARFEADGRTAVLVAAQTGSVAHPIGVIAIADRVRANARAALRALHAAGIRRTVMLTGDNRDTALAVARELGVDEVHAGLLPDDKVRLVREMQARGETVAFVGDGVNDAPALAAATVGVAMGAAGTDVALETADIALMADDLEKLALAVRASRRTVRIVRQNVVFAIAVKAVFLLLAAGGWATLWMAVAADMGAALAVVANGLRALRVR